MIEVCRVIERDAEPEWDKALSAYERDRAAADVRDKGWRDEVRRAATADMMPPDRPRMPARPTSARPDGIPVYA
jgi:hypothetical protein